MWVMKNSGYNWENKIDADLIRLLQHAYRSNKVDLTSKADIAEPAEIKGGFRQGCCLSPLPFMIHLNRLKKKLGAWNLVLMCQPYIEMAKIKPRYTRNALRRRYLLIEGNENRFQRRIKICGVEGDSLAENSMATSREQRLILISRKTHWKFLTS